MSFVLELTLIAPLTCAACALETADSADHEWWSSFSSQVANLKRGYLSRVRRNANLHCAEFLVAQIRVRVELRDFSLVLILLDTDSKWTSKCGSQCQNSTPMPINHPKGPHQTAPRLDCKFRFVSALNTDSLLSYSKERHSGPLRALAYAVRLGVRPSAAITTVGSHGKNN